MSEKSFSMLEMLVVIIIIGILVAMALPNFTKAKEYALGKEAIANLKLIAAAERIYRMESSNNAYASCSCSSGTDCNNTTNGCNFLLKLSLTVQNWTYRVSASGSGSTAAFTATADRRGSGGYLNCRYTLTHNDADGEPNPNSSCP